MVPCAAFEPGKASHNVVVRAHEGVVAAVAMHNAFVLRNVCDGSDDRCHVEKRALAELSPGSQVMLTTDGSALVAIDHDDGGVWTYEFDDAGRLYHKEATYTDEEGPASLVIGMRNSNLLIVRDRDAHLAVYQPTASQAIPIAEGLRWPRLAAVGEQTIAVRETHSSGEQTVYVVDVVNNPSQAHPVATGDFTSVVFGAGDQTLVLSQGRGADASVLVYDTEDHLLVDAFAGDLISSRTENEYRAIEELPGMHAVSPSGEQLAYRTTSGALAVRRLDTQTSCLVRNTNRMGTGRTRTRRAGDHAVAGFSADGLLYAEYTVGASDSFVYAYDPRHQQIVPLGHEQSGWHLAAVPGKVTDEHDEIERLWAVGVRRGSHASIAEGRVDGKRIGQELTFMPMADDGIWAIDTQDQLANPSRLERALSLRRVAPPTWNDGRLRFDQGPDEQVVTSKDEHDNEGPMRVPLSGRVCLSTGSPGSWAYRCGDSSATSNAFTTNSGKQEQTRDPNARPRFEPPFPDQGNGPSPDDPDGEPEDPQDSEPEDSPNRDD
ncbi:MAG: hypothetical protein AAGF11_51260 [Myxococcota bacterium]